MSPEQQLFLGAAMNNPDLIRDGVNGGADINGVFDENRHTPLTEAILGGMGAPEAVEVLLELGADAGRQDGTGITPWLACLSRMGDRVVAEEMEQIKGLLESAEASREGESALKLWEAACAGDLDTVRRLLEQGVAPAFADFCAVGAAAASGHHEVARLLLKHGAPAEGPRGEGDDMSTLMQVASRGDLAMVKLLVEYGADPDYGLPDDPDWTAARFAREKGHDEVADWLAERQSMVESSPIPAEALDGGPKSKYIDLYRQRVNAANYDLTIDDIVNRLMTWDRAYGIHVIDVHHDRLTVQFEKLPADMDAFTEELYDFCPDIVDQGFDAYAEMMEAPEEALPEDVRALVDGLDPEDERFGRKALGRWLQQHKAVGLWWD